MRKTHSAVVIHLSFFFFSFMQCTDVLPLHAHLPSVAKTTMDTYPQQHLPSSMLASDTQLGVGLPASSSVGSSQSVSLLLDYDKKWTYVDSSL